MKNCIVWSTSFSHCLYSMSCIIEWKNMLPHIIKLLYIFPSLFSRLLFLSHTHVVGSKKRNRVKIYSLPFAAVWHRKQKYVVCLLAFSFPFNAAQSRIFSNFKCAKVTLRWNIYTSSFPSSTSALCWSHLCLLLECKWQFVFNTPLR